MKYGIDKKLEGQIFHEVIEEIAISTELPVLDIMQMYCNEFGIDLEWMKAALMAAKSHFVYGTICLGYINGRAYKRTHVLGVASESLRYVKSRIEKEGYDFSGSERELDVIHRAISERMGEITDRDAERYGKEKERNITL